MATPKTKTPTQNRAPSVAASTPERSARSDADGAAGGVANAAAEGAENTPSTTVKRNPKTDLSKSDLTKLLAYLEGELQAREVVIAIQRNEKTRFLLQSARYYGQPPTAAAAAANVNAAAAAGAADSGDAGHSNLTQPSQPPYPLSAPPGDPMDALLRDGTVLRFPSTSSSSSSANANAAAGAASAEDATSRAAQETCLRKLEQLVLAQKRQQSRMRDLVFEAENKNAQLLVELEEEKQKHAQDQAQGDDVTYLLEKERERLRGDVEQEKGNAKKMEKEFRRTSAALDEERERHKQIVVMLVKERKRIITRLIQERHRVEELEAQLNNEKGRVKNMAEGLVQESKKSLKMEAVLERQLEEIQAEREAFKKQLHIEKENGKRMEETMKSLQQRNEVLENHMRMSDAEKEELQRRFGELQRAHLSLQQQINSTPIQIDGAPEPVTGLPQPSPTPSGATTPNCPPGASSLPLNTPFPPNAPPGTSPLPLTSPLYVNPLRTPKIRPSPVSPNNPSAAASAAGAASPHGPFSPSSSPSSSPASPRSPGSAPSNVSASASPETPKPSADYPSPDTRTLREIREGSPMPFGGKGSSSSSSSSSPSRSLQISKSFGSGSPLLQTAQANAAAAAAALGVYTPPHPSILPDLAASSAPYSPPVPQPSAAAVAAASASPSPPPPQRIYVANPAGTKVFTTPSGGKLTFHVSPTGATISNATPDPTGSVVSAAGARGPIQPGSSAGVRGVRGSAYSNTQSAPGGVGGVAGTPPPRGTPPPIPPNKPAFSPAPTQPASSGRKLPDQAPVVPNRTIFPAGGPSTNNSGVAMNNSASNRSSTGLHHHHHHHHSSSSGAGGIPNSLLHSPSENPAFETAPNAVLLGQPRPGQPVRFGIVVNKDKMAEEAFRGGGGGGGGASSPTSPYALGISASSTFANASAQDTMRKVAPQIHHHQNDKSDPNVDSEKRGDYLLSSTSPDLILDNHQLASLEFTENQHIYPRNDASEASSLSPQSIANEGEDSSSSSLVDPVIPPQFEDIWSSMTTSTEGETDNQSTGVGLQLAPSVLFHKIPRSLHCADVSPLHQAAAFGDVSGIEFFIQKHFSSFQLLLNQQTGDGSTALHFAAENGHSDCLKTLISNGADFRLTDANGQTALHAAVQEGHVDCARAVLEGVAAASAANADPRLAASFVAAKDTYGQTALHLAASEGQPEIARALMEFGADRGAITLSGRTPLHCAVLGGNFDAMIALLTYDSTEKKAESPDRVPAAISCDDQVLGQVDKDGWTFYHNAAAQETRTFLDFIVQHCAVDFQSRSKEPSGPTVYEVASSSCRELIDGIGGKYCGKIVQLIVVTEDGFETNVGRLTLFPDFSWDKVFELVVYNFSNHLRFICEDSVPGIEINSREAIKCLVIGSLKWLPGSHCIQTPYQLLLSQNSSKILLNLNSFSDGSFDEEAYFSLLSSSCLRNYYRLLSQYKSAIFCGPPKSGKSFIATKLAILLQRQHRRDRLHSEITQLAFTSSTSKPHFVKLLISKGALSTNAKIENDHRIPIIILDSLTKNTINLYLGEIFHYLERRGPANVFKISFETSEPPLLVYIPSSVYFIGTMTEEAGSSGLPLSLQQQLRWIQLKNNSLPLSNQLKLYLRKTMSNQVFSLNGSALLDSAAQKERDSSDDQLGVPVFGNAHKYFVVVLSWIEGIWVRLSECLVKIGLPELVTGPCPFFQCPVDASKPLRTLRWMSRYWNKHVAPQVERSILHQTQGMTDAGLQRKIAHTALFVLLQRTVAAGCPLSGEDKAAFLSLFKGSSPEGLLTSSSSSSSSFSARPQLPVERETEEGAAPEGREIPASPAWEEAAPASEEAAGRPSRLNLSVATEVGVKIGDAVEHSTSSLLKSPSSSLSSPSDVAKKSAAESGVGRKAAPPRRIVAASLGRATKGEKPAPGAPGNTAPRVMMKGKTGAVAGAPGNVPSSNGARNIAARSSFRGPAASSLSPGGVKTASSAFGVVKPASSLTHLRMASPANLGRINATSSLPTKSSSSSSASSVKSRFTKKV